MKKISIKLELTYSKIIALIILILGATLSFIIKSEGLMIATFSTVVIIIGNKQYNDRIKAIKSTLGNISENNEK